MSERLDKIYEAHCMPRQTTKAAFYLGYEVRLSEDIAPFKKLLNEKIEEIDRLTAELERYKQGVEVGAIVRSRGTSYAGFDYYVEIPMPKHTSGHRVRVLVMKEEVEG